MPGRFSTFVCSNLLIIMFSAAILIVTGCGRPAVKVWTVDPLTKVFRDEPNIVSDEPVAEAARGECASLQIVVRAAEKIEGLKATLEPLTLGNDKNARLEDIKVRFVGYVHVGNYFRWAKPASDQLRKLPADFPDILLEDKTIDVQANLNQPIWITIAVPATAKVGLYGGNVKITSLIKGKTRTLKVPVAVKVYDVTVGKSRLWLTNWFNMDKYRIAPSTDVNLTDLEKYSPAYWNLLRKYARNMAQHRQNVAILSPLQMTEYSIGEDGKLKFDFSCFDRAVEIFIDEGVIGRIEGGHLGGRIDKWNNQFEAYIYKIKDGKFVFAGSDPCSREADEFYSQFLPSLVEHLRQKGWLDIYVQHIADEPIPANMRSYAALARLVKKYAPQIKIIEACLAAKELNGLVDIWVPRLDLLSTKETFDNFKQRQALGEEAWFYTCMVPQGEYANRFIEQPLWKTRILHWINYQYGFTGYLHWAYNSWYANPFKDATVRGLPGGDSWIVYPGIDGPLDSIRFEAMRDGVADYELLCMLGEYDPAGAKALTARHIQAIDKYTCSVKSFRQTRRELLNILSVRHQSK